MLSRETSSISVVRSLFETWLQLWKFRNSQRTPYCALEQQDGYVSSSNGIGRSPEGVFKLHGEGFHQFLDLFQPSISPTSVP